MEVVPFGEHLCANENVQRASGESAKSFLILALGARSIAVEASDASAGELLAKALFQMFGAFAEKVDELGIALGASFGNRPNCAAIVAFQAIAAFVVGHGYAAVDALDGSAATAAENRPGIAAAVDEDQRLSLEGKTFGNGVAEDRGEGAGLVSLLKFLAKIDDFDRGERAILDTIGNGEELIFAGNGVVIGLQRGSGGTEEGYGVFEFGSNGGDVASMIARSFLLLVTVLLLLIDNDEAEFFERSEDGRARADNDASLPVADAPPFASALDIVEGGVEHSYAFELSAKPGAALAANPKGERDLGNEHQGGFAASESVLNAAQIDLGLATAGDAVKQLHAKLAKFETGANGIEDAFLCFVECVGGGFVAGIEKIFSGIDGLFPGFEEAVANHAESGGAGNLSEFEELRQGQGTAFGLEEGADSFLALAERRAGFRARLPGNDAPGAAFATSHGFAQLDEAATLETA